MNMYELILKKRNGGILSETEIREMIRSYTDGEVPDYQMSAMLMAIYFRGMNPQETVFLTKAMAESGDMLDLSDIEGIKVDKHSTGGVGDKTSLILSPMLAALGVPVAKMSGRGLGHTGGTIDKLESIPGFSTALSREKFISQVNTIHMAIAGQTANLAPADKKLYALRDVTGTVDQTALIASSIMSKKLASGADVIVLDVKCGTGAFMKEFDDAKELADRMVSIGEMAGKKICAVISDMNEPLGRMVGNSLEVVEAIEVLNGKGEARLTEISLTLASYMLVGAGKAKTAEEARTMLLRTIEDGSALKKFAEFVEAQGGDSSYVYHPEKFERGEVEVLVYPEENGFLSACDNQAIGMASVILGGGRTKKEDAIDPGVGIEICKKLGDAVNPNEAIAKIYARNPETAEMAKQRILAAYTICPEQPETNPIVREVRGKL